MATLHFAEGLPTPPLAAEIPPQLLPNVIDGLANTRPNALYAIIPKSFTTYEDGFRKVTYRQLANAINGAAKLISHQLGAGVKSQVLAYVGPNDIGYIVYILGAIKAGHKLLLLSPRSTKADLASMFNTTKCETLLTLPPPYSPTVANILEGVQPQPRVIEVPTIFELLDTSYEHFPYPKTFEAAKEETVVIVHTSGTTDTPKLISYNHAFAASYNRWVKRPPTEGHANVCTIFQSQRAFTTFPFFHGGAVQLALFDAVMNQSVMVTSLAGVPPSAQGVVDALKHVDVDVVHMVAPFLEQMSKRQDMLDFVLPRIHAISYGGADVSQAAVEAFSGHVDVASFQGSTESAPYPQLRLRKGFDPADSKYFQPHPNANFEFRETGMPQVFEAVIVRNEDPKYTQPVFHVYPDANEFRTKELYTQHRSKPGLWLFQGRADDMIVSAAGEMCNPIPFEQDLSRLPQVADALMVGAGRYQKALIIEPAKSESSSTDSAKQSFLDSIWPTVEVCNQKYPRVYHIDREHILLTQAEKPLRRAGKGSVQRAPSLQLYKDMIAQLYETAGDGAGQNAEPYDVHVSAKTD